jgi:CSLREA domain-containing protein
MPRLLALALPVLLLAASAARAQTTYTVTKVEDTDDGSCDADCSLREALAAADAGPDSDTIVFDPALAGQTITLKLGELRILQSVRIDGEDLGVVVSGNDASRVFHIGEQLSLEPTAELAGLTITGGRTAIGGAGVWIEDGTVKLDRCVVEDNTAEGDFAQGGGVYSSSGWLTVDSCAIRGNMSEGDGGGLAIWHGAGVIRNSTFSENDADDFGGGIYAAILGSAALVVENTTLTGNSAGSGGGIYQDYPSTGVTVMNCTITQNRTRSDGGGGVYDVAFRNSIVAGNTDAGKPNDCAFSASLGRNVVGLGGDVVCGTVGTDALVAPADVFTLVLDSLLAYHGGPTPTHALLWTEGNPALDIGGTCGPTDQRGFPAPVDGPDADADPACDAGAVEAERDLTAAEPAEPGAASFVLHAPYPNPAASRATLRFDLPVSSQVGLTVYDVLGRAVAVLMDKTLAAGRHEVVFDRSALPGGTYLVRLEAGGHVRARPVTHIR